MNVACFSYRSYTLPSTCKVHEMRSSFGNGKLVVTVPKTKPAIEDKKTTGQKTLGGSSSGRVRTIPIQSKSSFDTTSRDSAAYKTKEVNIDSDSEDSSCWPDSNLFRSRFDNWKMGTTFGDWIRPIQLFDEDFFMDSFQR